MSDSQQDQDIELLLNPPRANVERVKQLVKGKKKQKPKE